MVVTNIVVACGPCKARFQDGQCLDARKLGCWQRGREALGMLQQDSVQVQSYNAPLCLGSKGHGTFRQGGEARVLCLGASNFHVGTRA